jgi:hypothetical protein
MRYFTMGEMSNSAAVERMAKYSSSPSVSECGAL